ncbi:distal tail protein Dit [Aneurinibacillus aneurinilyticus]|uniref:Phage tail component protein n=1 Tax=Aneurinibacillus aneurinilyticus ATCC 12856 TaxID=649747 RepID=U1YJD3_ANEAE|nr:distal tail protein Dit [Aneurinibacillus aneurinilyticus]ERI10886.1 phage tail component protein [Aneurinibacillus aneurinilyticus ATCC 12856]MED0704955.1 phage tail family protein [Aneurinibacillus aneurinilyticus]MED0723095.1 phage tail family protein [Aneurinibacillus aneurinilyticus]MED0731476.1 phage tail family protein [Aneurinibacillus aneurinilyticus]MED0740099.1 phage tail family protein [Aneurinibacillus aneurinilyticus]
MSDFTYKSVSAFSMDVRVQSKKRPLLANIRQQYEDIAGRHGSYSFTDGTLEDITIDVECWFVADSREDLRYKARQIAAWLYSKEKQRLMFDDEPGVFYMARVSNQIDMETLIRHGRFTLQFRCDPFAYFVEEKITRHAIIASPQTFTVSNDATAPTQPILIIRNNGDKPVNNLILRLENEVE